MKYLFLGTVSAFTHRDVVVDDNVVCYIVLGLMALCDGPYTNEVGNSSMTCLTRSTLRHWPIMAERRRVRLSSILCVVVCIGNIKNVVDGPTDRSQLRLKKTWSD